MSRQAPQYFNHLLLRHRLAKAENGWSTHSPINQAVMDIADSFAERLSLVNRKFRNALIWGYRPELVINALQKYNRLPERITLASITPECLRWTNHGAELTAPPTQNSVISPIVIDLELLPFAGKSFDLVLSFGNLHWVNDLPGMLAQIQMVLEPDGLFQAVMAGGNSLCEINETLINAELQATGGAAARVAPFMQLHDGAALMQRAQYALSVVDIERLQLKYENTMAALTDFRQSGLANIPTQVPPVLTKKMAGSLKQNNQAKLVSLELAYMSGWRPAASQPKPIKRGSAQKSLADFL